MKEIVYQKLVRDKIVEILRSQGHRCIVKKLASEHYKKALINKLKEEVNEFIKAKHEADQLEELSDILEVIHAILKEQGKTFSEIESIRREKWYQKGGFEQGIFLERSFLWISERHCLFCIRAKSIHQILSCFTHCFVIWDKNPVSKGHLLIIPYNHYAHWFEAPKEVQIEITSVLDLMRAKLDALFHPDGYNIGMNCGETAGQTIMHLHVHLIPRYQGDMTDPRGGVRGVIPEKQKYGN